MNKKLKPWLSLAVTFVLVQPSAPLFAASHREAPITSLDRTADITDFYAFVSYENPNNVVFIMNVDPLLDPGNGPNYFPFDPDVLYSIHVDNTNSAADNVRFDFRFQTEIRAPGLAQGFAGALTGINAPADAPAPLGQGTPIVPPAITSLDGAGSAGFSLRQHYTVSMVVNGVSTPLTTSASSGLIAVPSNVGPRTMPNYTALAQQGIFSLGNGIRVFTGTVDDPFYIDLGATFDTLNLRAGAFPVRHPRRADPRAGRQRQRELRGRQCVRLQRQHHRYRSAHRHADADRNQSGRHRSRLHHRRLGHHIPPPHHRSQLP